MKAYIALIALTGALALASCGGDDDNETAAPPAEEVVGGTNHSVLIAYFSEPLPDNGVDAATSASRLTIDGTTYGSVQFVASIIQEATGGDMIRIQTATPYPTDYTSLAAQADTERRDGIHHELATEIENFADYDVVFVGYPIWWYQLPMPLLVLRQVRLRREDHHTLLHPRRQRLVGHGDSHIADGTRGNDGDGL